MSLAVDDAVTHVGHPETTPVHQRLGTHPPRIDAVELGIAEIRHHQRVIRQQVDVDRELRGRRYVWHTLVHGPLTRRPKQLTVPADQGPASHQPMVAAPPRG